MTRFFEIVPGVAAWATLGILTIFSWQLPAAVAVFILLYDLYFLTRTVYLFLHLRVSFRRMRQNLALDWRAKVVRECPGWERIYHLVLYPTYHEPYEVIRESMESVRASRYPLQNVLVVLATEARGGETDAATSSRIVREYEAVFGGLFVTQHPSDIPGELAGKGSNETWAAQQALRELIDAKNIPRENVVVSVFDIDTRVPPDYFNVLTHAFCTESRPLRSSYQPIPLYTNNIQSVSVFARLISFSASFWQFMQQSRPEQLVTFSSHSVPLQALIDVGFWHTDIVSEDSRITFQCLDRYAGDWRVTPLFYPVYMDAVTGETTARALANLYKQQRRWAWGTENFAYVATTFIKNRAMPLRKKLFWIVTLFDGAHSWATSSIIIFLFGFLPNVLGGDAFTATVTSYNLPRLTGILINASAIGIITSAFLSTFFITPYIQSSKRKTLAYIMHLMQWVFMPLTFIVFSAIPALEAQTRLALSGRFRLGFWKTPKQGN